MIWSSVIDEDNVVGASSGKEKLDSSKVFRFPRPPPMYSCLSLLSPDV